MVGNRSVVACVVLAVGCGSSTGSPGAGGSGGSAQSAAGQGAGGRAGSANGGAPGGGVAGSAGVGGGNAGVGGGNAGGLHGGGGASGGQSGSGGAGGNAGGASGAGGLPACVGDDDASAPFVDFLHSAEPTPVAMGGTLVSGKYFLTALTYYGGTPVKTDCTFEPTHEVLRVTAASATAGSMLSTELHRFSDGTGEFSNVQSYSYAVQGSALLMDYTCWEPDEYSQPYSATNSRILQIRGPFDSGCDDGVTLVLTYDKQP